MSSLSDTITRKFIDQADASDWEVLTDTGYHSITSSNKTIEYEVFELILSNGYVLKCADDHIVFKNDIEEVFVKDLSNGDMILTDNGPVSVVSVTNLGYSENMYDLSVDSEDHRFYTNGILSHNTTCVAAYLCWYINFSDNTTSAILANKASAAREIMSRLQQMYENLPKWLQKGVSEWNKGSVTLGNEKNASKAFTAATSSSGIRGKTCNLVYVDEAAIIPNTVAEEFFTATYPTISSGTSSKIILTSTPLGLNHFWKFWSEAMSGVNGFTPVRVDYWEHPDHDDAWAEQQRELLGELKFQQEIGMSFLGSSSTLISGAKLAALPYKKGENLFTSYFEYETPKRDDKGKPLGNYVITVDTSRGSELDNSAFVVFDISEMPYKVVARYANNSISTLMYPEVIYKVAKRFNNAFVLIETNDLGQQVADILFYDLEYENVYMSLKDKLKEGGGEKKTPGIRTTKRTKAIGCDQLKTLVESDHLVLNDSEIINELTTFIRVGSSYKADENKKDDLAMCLVMFAYLTQEAVFKELFDYSLRQTFIRRQIDEFDEQITPIGFVDRGGDMFDDFDDSDKPYNPDLWVEVTTKSSGWGF
jgi:hypothetical protein